MRKPSPAVAALGALLLGGTGFALWGLTAEAPPAPRVDAPSGGDWTAALAGLSEEGFARPTGPWTLDLPADHGAHPEARMESWGVFAQLSDENGGALALALSWSRLGLVPLDRRRADDPWAPAALHRAHAALTDGGSAAAEERFSRGALGSAGHDAAAREVRLDDWILRYGLGADGTALAVDARIEGVRAALTLRPLKAPSAPEIAEGGPPLRAYALTRMAAEGEAGGRAVSGVAWVEHAWGALPLPGGPVAQDRLIAHLDDGAELALTRTRRADGAGTPTVEGFLVEADGAARPLEGGLVAMTAEEIWRDAAGAPWPVAWRLEGGGLDLSAAPLAEDQRRGFLAPIWAGGMRLSGERDGAQVSGRGFATIAGATER